jgi:tight adherence protein B
MNPGLIIIILFAVVVLAVGLAVLFDVPIPGLTRGMPERAGLRTMLQSQRQTADTAARSGKAKTSIFDIAKKTEVKKSTLSSRRSLAKRLRYAQWKIPPVMYYVAMLVVSLITLTVAISIGLNFLMQGIALLVGPIMVGWLLNSAIERRFKAFDSDYPAFLLSLVGLLKTGMNPMNALEAASSGMNEGAMVKAEVDMMIERLRFGVSEDKSIGSFGEDIDHPEIELFVQALLLSRRVGGTLSDTLDRLAKQVRKRQYFRQAANAAVGMQRGSIWFIIAILCALETYLYFTFPETVTDALKDKIGWQVWQFSICVILLGIFWVRQVTKIRT